MRSGRTFVDKKLKSVREGEGTLLTNCMVVLGGRPGGFVKPTTNHHLPAILCGGKGLGDPAPRTSLSKKTSNLGTVANDVSTSMNVPVAERL